MKNYRHKQIRSVILERIEQGFYDENQQIPKSKALAAEFGTSSITIDRALSALADRGFVRRIARKGTFVNPRSQWDRQAGAGGHTDDQETSAVRRPRAGDEEAPPGPGSDADRIVALDRDRGQMSGRGSSRGPAPAGGGDEREPASRSSEPGTGGDARSSGESDVVGVRRLDSPGPWGESVADGGVEGARWPAAAERSGRKPHGREPGAGRSGIVAMIVHDAAVPYQFWTKALRGIEDALSSHGMHVIVGSNNLTIDRVIGNIEDLSRKGIDGVIYVPMGASSEHEYEQINGRAIATLERLGVPHIMLNRHVGNAASSFVVGDEERSAEALTRTLLDTGVTNPICITQDYITPFADRELGFRQVLEERGFTDIDQRIIHVLPYPQQIDQRYLGEMVEILRRSGADGVFSVNNHIVTTVLKAADILHAEDGRTIQAVNYDSVEGPERERIAQTAVPQAYNMGYIAAEILVSLKLHRPETVFRVYEPCLFSERRQALQEALPLQER